MLPSTFMKRCRSPTHAARELFITQKLNHPHIIKQTSEARGVICMERGFGDLHTFFSGKTIEAHTPELFALLVRFSLEISSSIEYIHSRGVVHNDIKPENVVLFRTSNGSILPKMIDFEFSHLPLDWHSHLDANIANIATSGTLMYMSPRRKFTLESAMSDDVWAFGKTMITLSQRFCEVHDSETTPLVGEYVRLAHFICSGETGRICSEEVHNTLSEIYRSNRLNV